MPYDTKMSKIEDHVIYGVGFSQWLTVLIYTPFLRASTMHVLAIGCQSVRPSVCHTLVLYQNGWIIVMLSSPHDSPFILVLCISRSSRNSDWGHPCGAAKQSWGMKMSQFSTNNLLYLRNDCRYAARRFTSIESSFQPCEFTAIVLGAYPGEAKMCKKMC